MIRFFLDDDFYGIYCCIHIEARFPAGFNVMKKILTNYSNMESFILVLYEVLLFHGAKLGIIFQG